MSDDNIEEPVLKLASLHLMGHAKSFNNKKKNLEVEAINRDREAHRVEMLNEKQREIFDYVKSNISCMVVIQAGPGTGKTFTLKTIAHNSYLPATAVIFKHDLLKKFYYCAERWTVAKLFMSMFEMNYFAYKAFTMQISGKMSPQEFIYCMLSLLHRVIPPKVSSGIVLIDEYTVIQKPLLVILLIILKRYKVCTVISGDCNQLQSIQRTQNDGITAFEIAKMFSERVFTLDINERCPDQKFNEVIKYLSKLSSSNILDNVGYALIAALFLDKLGGNANFDDIHLAGTHRELTRLIHMYVVNENIPVEFYQVDRFPKKTIQEMEAEFDKFDFEEGDEDEDMDTSIELPDGMLQPSIVNSYVRKKSPGKFLPYLPLHIGSTYYIEELTESSIGTLVDYSPEMETVTMRCPDGTCKDFKKKSNNKVVFEPHRVAILQKYQNGAVYNYPIYPTNVMTMHRCQGCTITAPLDINLTNTSYQGMYVAISRVTNPDGIKRIMMPDLLSYIFSTIINFPEHIHKNFNNFTEELLNKRMTNYKFYKIEDPKPIIGLLSEFLDSTDTHKRAIIRKQLVEMSKGCSCTLLNLPDTQNREDLLAINRFVEDMDTLVRAATIEDKLDRAIWLHEYMRMNVNYSMLLQEPICYKHNSLEVYCNPTYAYPFNKNTSDYIADRAELQDELSARKNAKILFRHDECYYKVATTRFQNIMYWLHKKAPEQDMDRDENEEISPDPELANSELSIDWLMSLLPDIPYNPNTEPTPPSPPPKKLKFTKFELDKRPTSKRRCIK